MVDVLQACPPRNEEHVELITLLQNPVSAQAVEHVALLEEWVQLMRSRDKAAQAVAQAQACG